MFFVLLTFVLVFSVFHVLYGNNPPKSIYIISVILLILVGGFRYFVGIDYEAYKLMYELDNDSSNYLYYVEPGWSVIYNIIHFVKGTYILWFLVINAITVISRILGLSILPSAAHKNKAGSVKIAPAARDSPAEPMVCTRLLSKMEFFFIITRMTPIEITAAGIDADTVIPTRNPRYAFAAPNTTARRTPIIMDVTVSSGVTFSGAIYGLNSCFSFNVILLSP